MRVPDFLIIGAMKAGTTTLYRDLEGHPDLHMPGEKEPEILINHEEDDAAIRKDFASLFVKSAPGQLCGEASTAYTKRPDNEGVAARALRICGPELKLIYLTRDPMGRAISHYKHDRGYQRLDSPFAQAIREDQRYINYSRYEWQLQPWIDAFGREALLELRFEDYIADREGVSRKVCDFLGVDPDKLPAIDSGAAFNASDGKPVTLGKGSQKLIGSRFYQRTLKGLIPRGLRSFVAQTVLPKAPKVAVTVDPETEAYFRETLRSA